MRRLFLSAPPITPRSIPGCVLWLEADRIPQATYAADSFTRADSASSLGTADSGQAWTAKSGTWGISSNKAYLASTNNNDYAVVDAGVADVVVEVTISTLAGVAGIYFRATDTSNWWRFLEDSGNWYLQKNNAGSVTTVSTAASGGSSGDVLKVVARGSVITVYRNGTQLATTTDAFSSTVTTHGIGMAGAGNGSIRLDDFAVRLNNDGDPLNTWPDLSGFGNHATQSTPTNQPVVKTGIVNGRPVVRTDGVNDLLLTPILGLGAHPYTIVAVIRPVTVGAVGVNDVAISNIAAGSTTALGIDDNAAGSFSAYAGSTLRGGGVATAGRAYVVAGVFNGSTSSLYVDGAVAATGAIGANAPQGLTIGALTGGSRYVNHDFAFIGAWNRALSASELSRLNRKYLAGRYAIAAT